MKIISFFKGVTLGLFFTTLISFLRGDPVNTIQALAMLTFLSFLLTFSLKVVSSDVEEWLDREEREGSFNGILSKHPVEPYQPVSTVCYDSVVLYSFPTRDFPPCSWKLVDLGGKRYLFHIPMDSEFLLEIYEEKKHASRVTSAILRKVLRFLFK